MDVIDLRSDTLTQPTEEMRQAMANAEVGDDVYGEDPSINKLQERAAEMLGKEAGLVPEHMGLVAHDNLIAPMAIGQRSHQVAHGAAGH